MRGYLKALYTWEHGVKQSSITVMHICSDSLNLWQRLPGQVCTFGYVQGAIYTNA